MSAEGRPLAVLTEESEHQLGVLRRALKRGTGFALYVVVAKDLGRVELLRRLRTWSGAGGVPDLHFFPVGAEGASAVDALLAARDEAHALAGAVIPDGGALIDVEEGNALSALNVARDVLDRVIRGPLLLVLSPEREADLARMAPDLFDVRAGTVAVEAVVVEAGPVEVSRIGLRHRDRARPVAGLQGEGARLRVLAESEDPPLGALADAWVRIGYEFLDRGEIGEAREAAKVAHQLAVRGGYKSGVAYGIALEGDVLGYLGDLDEAQTCYEVALAIEEDLGDRPAIAVLYKQLGIVAQKGGDLDKAQGWHEMALAIEEELGNRPGTASSYHLLGMIAQSRGELDKAQGWYEKAVIIDEDLGNRSGMASTYHELSILAQYRGELDKAQEWCEKSLALEDELGNRAGMAGSYHQLGRLAEGRGELDNAQEWCERSLAIEDELGDRAAMTVTSYLLGHLAERRHHPAQALDWMVRAVALFPDFPHPMTSAAPEHLVRLTATLGMPALEATWQRVTGQPLPAQVRSYVEAHPRPS